MAETETEPRKTEVAAPTRVPMIFSSDSWTATFRFNRSGRMESEAAYALGEIAYRIGDEPLVKRPARLAIVKRDANQRLELRLRDKMSRLVVPLDDFAMQRMLERMKEYVSGYNMIMRVVFQATDTDLPQYLEAVDFSFSSRPHDAAEPAPATPAAGDDH
ncbi:hypothetical protein J2R99_000609 [Rhodopseudomonas julia]|uniref:Uncharacterized protein n=1 Tax=Rhodopseudomonas julia TaxID=200617 RepID=A0ABU0C2P7_9BRAD|nr:hypothetical protein [Rhodopseudomonas julia]MDQ0324760.1 hypothetical protein [Rhodopseudomonas julia]